MTLPGFSSCAMAELEFAQLTDVGCVREENEDAVASWELADGVLFAVADGLGGYAAGEVASALALGVVRAEQVQYGLMSAEQARTHPKRNMLTRCLGRELIVGIDVLTLPIHRGDVLIQCSDGMHGTIEDAEIIAIVGRNGPDASCRALIEH